MIKVHQSFKKVSLAESTEVSFPWNASVQKCLKHFTPSLWTPVKLRGLSYSREFFLEICSQLLHFSFTVFSKKFQFICLCCQPACCFLNGDNKHFKTSWSSFQVFSIKFLYVIALFFLLLFLTDSALNWFFLPWSLLIEIVPKLNNLFYSNFDYFFWFLKQLRVCIKHCISSSITYFRFGIPELFQIEIITFEKPK